MPAYNKVMLMGHLTKDPELQYTPGGTAITTFTIAINRKWKGKDEEVKEEVDFIDCKAFTGIAETIANHLVKGNPLFVEGRITVEKWEDKEGQKKSRTRIIVEKFCFIGSKKQGQGGETSDDEIPF